MKHKFYVLKTEYVNGLYQTLYSKDDNGYFHHVRPNDRRCECLHVDNKYISKLIELPASSYNKVSQHSTSDRNNTTLINEMKKQALYEAVLEDT